MLRERGGVTVARSTLARRKYAWAETYCIYPIRKMFLNETIKNKIKGYIQLALRSYPYNFVNLVFVVIEHILFTVLATR